MIPKILVALSNRYFSLNPLYYGCELAIRLQARIDVLCVTSPKKHAEISEEEFLKEMAIIIDNYREKGVSIESYLTKGIFLDEISRFIKKMHTDIVVVAELQNNSKFPDWLASIRKDSQKALVVVVNPQFKKE